MNNYSDNCSETFLKIFRLGHPRSGQQVRSSDPTSEKLSNRVTTSGGEKEFKLSGFCKIPSTYNFHISDFIYVGDVRSDQFRDLLIVSMCVCVGGGGTQWRSQDFPKGWPNFMGAPR